MRPARPPTPTTLPTGWFRRTNGAGAVVTYAYGQNSDPTCVSYPNSSNNTCTSPGSGRRCSQLHLQFVQPAQPRSPTGPATPSPIATTPPDSRPICRSTAVPSAWPPSYDDAGNVASIDATASSGATPLLDLSVTRAENGQIATEIPDCRDDHDGDRQLRVQRQRSSDEWTHYRDDRQHCLFLHSLTEV